VLGRDAPVLTKHLVLDLASLTPRLGEGLKTLEDFEGLSFGPPLPDGRTSLLMISDDHFNDRQVTACLVLAMNR
jgi:hypothetical protein